LATAGREVGRQDAVLGDRKGGECLVLDVSIIWNVGTESSAMKIECFPGIRKKQLYRVLKIET